MLVLLIVMGLWFSRVHAWTTMSLSYEGFLGHSGDHVKLHRTWLEQKGCESTFYLSENIRDMRLGDKSAITVAGRRRRWSIDLEKKVVGVTGWIDAHEKPVVTDDGRRILTFMSSFPPVLKDGDHHVVMEDSCPIFVYASGKTGRVLTGLCSERIHLWTGKQSEGGVVVPLVEGSGAPLCGSLCGDYAFVGCMDGTVAILDVSTRDWVVHSGYVTGRASPVRCLDVVSLGVAGYSILTGHHDGSIRTYSWSPPSHTLTLHSVFCDLFDSPVTCISGSPLRMATADENGRVVVSNRLGVVMWSFKFPARGTPVLLQMTDRYLIVAGDKTVRIWDHLP